MEFQNMTNFDVLNRNLNVHKSYLIEASAGTGKTFSIENIVARLLIEDDAISIDRILAVTFTRAATRDLRIRIRTTLECLLVLLKNPQENVPDYLLAIIEQGPEKIKQAKRSLEQALVSFDQAQIFTIHGFCQRMLSSFVFESDFDGSQSEEKSIKKEEIIELIRDFFRTEILPDAYSPAQLQIVMNHFHRNKIEQFQEALLKLLNKECEICLIPNYSESLKAFNTAMQTLKSDYQINTQHLIKDFERQKSYYKPIKDKDVNNLYSLFNLFDKPEWSAEDFDQFLLDEWLWIGDLLSLDNAYVKKVHEIPLQNSLHYPQLIQLLNQHLKPLLLEAGSYESIIARMAADCRQLLNQYLGDEEKHRKSDLLKKMLTALDNPYFVNKVKGLFKAAIIDEFQDTDPIQWEIFKRLFMDIKLYLVGDPKQSIYAFRQADIYTYLSAAGTLGAEHHTSLDTNYRSQPSLVIGLNKLFSSCPQLFPLPAISKESQLNYPVVNHAKSAKLFSDDRHSIHFFAADIKISKKNKSPSRETEEEFFFPFIAQEIIHLHNNDQLDFNQFAVLIKDKNQAQRIGQFFDQYAIPYNLQRQGLLTDSPAWDALKELLQAILHPKDESSFKMALGGEILGWNYSEIKTLEDNDILERLITEFINLKKCLSENGFAHLFHQLQHSSWHTDGLTVTEKILGREGGEEFYDELCQIAALLMTEESNHPSNPEYLVDFLKEYKQIPQEDDDRLKQFSDPTRNAVSILTTFNSKGLEFDIVFALGLIGRPHSVEQLIPRKEGLTQCLYPCPDSQSEMYINYCKEIDAEKMRQLYVALTRAKYRLYIPIAYNSAKTNFVDFGFASPMELFLARLGQSSADYQELYQRIEKLNTLPLNEFINMHKEFFSYSNLNGTLFSLNKMKSAEPLPLTQPAHVDIPGEPLFIQSFTSLSKQKNQAKETLHLPVPHDFRSLIKSSHTLPSGNLTGTILHSILETVPFAEQDDITSWIKPHIQGTEFEPWENTFSEIVHNAFKAPLNGFCLADIDPHLIFRETEFLYPCNDNMTIPDLEWSKGFLKGVIDLIFYHNDRYYLLDWKSNWLGPNESHYTQENMHAAMLQHDYYTQAYIYKEALKRYLKLVDSRPFEEIYGGCYYVFLRGLDASGTTGIQNIE
jgi:exodeoxyribonuclease V beta subunit